MGTQSSDALLDNVDDLVAYFQTENQLIGEQRCQRFEQSTKAAPNVSNRDTARPRLGDGHARALGRIRLIRRLEVVRKVLMPRRKGRRARVVKICDRQWIDMRTNAMPFAGT